MSDKRPETSADIITRSKVVLGRGAQAPARRRRGGYSVDLPRHMAECDANYYRLLRLFPALRHTREPVQFGVPPLDATVHISVLEQGPYTTLVQIDTATVRPWLHWAAAPRLSVRAYHDAKSAEVVAYQNRDRFHGKYDYPNTHMRQRDEKVQINRFLSEFLTLCLEHGAVDDVVQFEG